METKQPDIQLISNVIAQREDGDILFVRYDPDDTRWWLPGEDLRAYQHPDEMAEEVLGAFPGLEWRRPTMLFVESFRGRRGWHVVFHYLAPASGDPSGTQETAWFPADGLPRTMHGKWEHDAVARTLELAAAQR